MIYQSKGYSKRAQVVVFITVISYFLIFSQSLAWALSLSSVGDVCLGGSVANYTSRYGFDYPYQNVKDILSSTDITFGNLECALSTQGKAGKKKFTFRGSPENARFLRDAGFDVISFANNHSKDFGNQAFVDTLNNLEASQVKAIGGGRNVSQAYQHQVVEVNGERIAFLAFSDILTPGFVAKGSSPGVASLRNKKLVFEAIRRAKSETGFVVVSLHWGTELKTAPSKAQIKLAHQLVDQGADVILGHHPHVVQGVEVYNGKVVFYSMGNFVFSPGNAKGRQSMLVTTSVEQGRVTGVKIYPIRIDGIQPRILTGTDGQAWLNEITARSRGFNAPLELDATSESYPYLKLTL